MMTTDIELSTVKHAYEVGGPGPYLAVTTTVTYFRLGKPIRSRTWMRTIPLSQAVDI